MVNGVVLEEAIKNYIQHRAAASKTEVYGWLIGFDNPKGDVFITAPLDCTRYDRQSVSDAVPNIDELHIVSAMMIQGMGIVGIYHSHPREVFHSSTDDYTVQTLAKMYPNIVSIVTNGDETRCYRLLDGKIGEVSPTQETLPPTNYLNFQLPIKSQVHIGSKTRRDQIDSLVSTQLQTALQDSLEKCHFKLDGKRLKDKQRLSKLPSGSAVLLQPSHWQMPSKDTLTLQGRPILTSVETTLKARVIVREGERLRDLRNAIENELADDLVQKIASGKYFHKEKRYTPAQTIFIKYLQAHLKLYIPFGKPDPDQYNYCKELVNSARLLLKLGKQAEALILLLGLSKYFGGVGDKELQSEAKAISES